MQRRADGGLCRAKVLHVPLACFQHLGHPAEIADRGAGCLDDRPCQVARILPGEDSRQHACQPWESVLAGAIADHPAPVLLNKRQSGLYGAWIGRLNDAHGVDRAKRTHVKDVPIFRCLEVTPVV